MLEQHQRFADKYFETLNGAESARYAGFAESSARAEASRLLDRQDVQEYLQRLRLILAEKTGISQQKVLNEIAKIAFSDIRNYYEGDGQLKNIVDLDDNEAAALASIKSFEEIEPRSGMVLGVNKEIKIYDKLAGLEKLARHLGLYKEDNSQKSTPIQLLNFDPINAVTGNDGPAEDISTS